MGNATHIEQGLTQIREAATQLLASLSDAEPGDREAAALSLEIAASLGVVEQAAHGLRLQVLAHADRLKAARGGIGPWLAAHQGQTKGHARNLAQDARLLATVPQLAPDLASGQLSTDAVRLLARTVKACTNTTMDVSEEITATLKTARAQGVSAAADHVRDLEHRLDPDKLKNQHAKQRERSQARAGQLDNGMWHFEILLDPARAATLKTALDALTASWLRAQGRDGIAVLPPDVKSTEQITAHAFHHLAQVFLAAPTSLRRAALSPPVVFIAPLPAAKQTQESAPPTTNTPTGGHIPAGSALTAYGDIVPLPAIGPVQDSTTHLLHTDQHGQPALLDGEDIDRDPDARLASHAQRIALAYRDRECTFNGCGRPSTWALDIHHLIPRSRGGATTLRNLASLCQEHHITTHHPNTH
jgi:Domain of unknown function (DUF222)/HNH endonuclease